MVALTAAFPNDHDREAKIAKIFCIDDDRAVLELLSILLRNSGHEVIKAENGQEALAMLPTFTPDIIICDIEMPGMNGFQFLQVLREEHHELDEIPFIFMSSHNDYDDLITGLELGADDYLKKPVESRYLMAKVKAFMRQISRMQEKKEHEYVKIYKTITKKLCKAELETFEAYDLLLDRLEHEYDERYRLKEMLTELKSKLNGTERKNADALKKIIELERSLDTALKDLLAIRAEVTNAKKNLCKESMSVADVKGQLDSISKSVEVTIFPIQDSIDKSKKTSAWREWK